MISFHLTLIWQDLRKKAFAADTGGPVIALEQLKALAFGEGIEAFGARKGHGIPHFFEKIQGFCADEAIGVGVNGRCPAQVFLKQRLGFAGVLAENFLIVF